MEVPRGMELTGTNRSRSLITRDEESNVRLVSEDEARRVSGDFLGMFLFSLQCAILNVLSKLSIFVAQWYSWLVRRPVTPEVEGSSPF